MNKSKLIVSSACAAMVTIVFISIIVIWAEFSAPFKDWLKNLSGHHWVSKSIFSILLYLTATGLLYALPYKYSNDKIGKIISFLLVSTALGIAVIFLFFTGHYFKFF
jgi:hypothetical protein